MARTYLAQLSKSGHKVARIIQMVPRPGRLGRLLPTGFRGQIGATRQHLAAHYWPHQLAEHFPGLYSNMIDAIGGAYGLKREFFEELRSKRGLETYADDVAQVELDGVGDPALLEALTSVSPATVLFTGGGILPSTVFDVAGIKLLHVHPGRLPYVRGADGVLWSSLVRGSPGVSCFIMRPGLDEGDVIEARDLPALTFRIPGAETPDPLSLYRMLFSYYDPVLRSQLLADVVESHGDITELSGTPQDHSSGVTYHFMERRLRDIALAKLFLDGAE